MVDSIVICVFPDPLPKPSNALFNALPEGFPSSEDPSIGR